MKELTLDATVEALSSVLAFVDAELEGADCPMKTQMQIDVAVEEIYVNIASYAYAPGTGPATIRLAMKDEPPGVSLTFVDQGKPYDPLAREDPDVTLSAGERGIGGLGILMTKKLMDELRYQYQNGQNVLTMEKHW